MNEEHITMSAAFYFDRKDYKAIPERWFERACAFFSEYGLSPILFTADGGGFLLDDCYVLAERGWDLTIFGELIEARGRELVDALQNGRIESLSLDSPRSKAEYREDWRATVDASLIDGLCYVGIDHELIANPSALLRRAYRIIEGTLGVCYGIAYRSASGQDPLCYAMGRPRRSFTDVLGLIRHRREWEQRKKTPDELWGDELMAGGRHLGGLFRGAYPANLLSEAHLRRLDLPALKIGSLSRLDRALWLWELSELEIPIAEKVMRQKGALIQ